MAPRQQSDLARWLPVAAAGGLLVVVVGVGVARGGGGDDSAVLADTTSTTAIADTAPAGTPSLVTTPTSVPVVKTPLERTLGDGVTGDDVRIVQQRLADMGFDPGPVDGVYGGVTVQAVWAFEKLLLGTPRQQATGKVTPEMWDRMQDPIQVAPRRPSAGGNHVEVYLPEQVLAVFHDNVPVLVAHVASGELDAGGQPIYYCDKATWDTDAYGNPYPEPKTGEACAYAKTPGGVFTIHRMETGHHVSSLGGMDNPVYFNYGIAIHGADNVPLSPASHGCVRINQHLATYFQSLVAKGDKVLVWPLDGTQPEDVTYEDSLPSFDARHYDTTTTSTTTSTTTTSTTVPGTQPPPDTATTATPDATPTPEPGTTTTTPDPAAPPEPTPAPPEADRAAPPTTG